jgi:hypothetical protein
VTVDAHQRELLQMLCFSEFCLPQVLFRVSNLVDLCDLLEERYLQILGQCEVILNPVYYFY